MPIKENKRNHDFEWEFEVDSTEQTPVTVALRYHHTKEFGPTISMLDDNNNVGYSFPAAMFTDVSEEIRRIDNLHSGKNSSKPVYREKTAPSARVSMPTITGSPGMYKTGAPAQQPIEEKPEPVIPEPLEGVDIPKGGFESFTVEPKKKAKADDIIAERGSSREEWAAARAEGSKKASKKSIKRAEDSN